MTRQYIEITMSPKQWTDWLALLDREPVDKPKLRESLLRSAEWIVEVDDDNG